MARLEVIENMIHELRDIGPMPEAADQATPWPNYPLCAYLATVLDRFPEEQSITVRQTTVLDSQVRDCCRRIATRQAAASAPTASANTVPPVRKPQACAARPAPTTGIEIAI